MLLTIESVIPKQKIDTVLKQLSEASWENGANTAGSIAREVKANLQLDDNNPLAKTLSNEVLSYLGKNSDFISAALPHTIYPPKFNCYQEGGHYGSHVDSAVMYLPDQQMMRSDISATLFLSDPDSYEGGELLIETNYGAQVLKLNAGDMVIYPSTSLHQVMPVTQGARISSFFWVQSMVRDSQQRGILFDLDQSIQQLTIDRGVKDEEVQGLQGIYHNLLRMWTL